MKSLLYIKMLNIGSRLLGLMKLPYMLIMSTYYKKNILTKFRLF